MDADPFGLSGKRIAGSFQLERFESGKFYLMKDGHQGSGGGILDGVVLEIGWNADVIAARRKANFRGDPDGWMIVEIRSETVSGPISDESFRSSHPSLSTYQPEVAWSKL
jgi:hypothetical protein